MLLEIDTVFSMILGLTCGKDSSCARVKSVSNYDDSVMEELPFM